MNTARGSSKATPNRIIWKTSETRHLWLAVPSPAVWDNTLPRAKFQLWPLERRSLISLSLWQCYHIITSRELLTNAMDEWHARTTARRGAERRPGPSLIASCQAASVPCKQRRSRRWLLLTPTAGDPNLQSDVERRRAGVRGGNRWGSSTNRSSFWQKKRSRHDYVEKSSSLDPSSFRSVAGEQEGRKARKSISNQPPN